MIAGDLPFAMKLVKLSGFSDFLRVFFFELKTTRTRPLRTSQKASRVYAMGLLESRAPKNLAVFHHFP
jgi:hypothetical protein